MGKWDFLCARVQMRIVGNVCCRKAGCWEQEADRWNNLTVPREGVGTGEPCGALFTAAPSCLSACLFQAPLPNAAPLSTCPVQTIILPAMILKDGEPLQLPMN